MNYHFRVRKDERGGFTAFCIELKGCQTEADSKEILSINMEEVLGLYLDENPDSKTIFPKTNPLLRRKKGIVAVQVPPRIAFAMLLRQARLQEDLSIRQAAQALGMSSPSEYFKLESGKSANPVFSTLVKIKKLFPDIDINEALAA